MRLRIFQISNFKSVPTKARHNSLLKMIKRAKSMTLPAAASGCQALRLLGTDAVIGLYVLSHRQIKGTTATAIVTFYQADFVKVSLIQEGGVWKIDKVKNDRGEGLKL
jgi:hypothetical protein